MKLASYAVDGKPAFGAVVADGVVTLSGKVASDEQRRIAEDTVSDLPGVVRVNNDQIGRASCRERV